MYDQHVYPGFIATNTTLGITEISAVRATNDYREVEHLNLISTLIAYNAESKIIPTIRSNGVLMAQIAPKGGRITGTSSVMKMNGWNWEDAAQKVDDGIHLISQPILYSTDGGQNLAISKTDRYSQQIESINHYFQKRDHIINQLQKTIDLELAAMSGLFDASKCSMFMLI